MEKILKFILLFTLLIFVSSCFYTSSGPPKSIVKDNKYFYRVLFPLGPIDSVAKVKKTAYAYMPYGFNTYSITSFILHDTPQKKMKLNNQTNYIGYGNNIKSAKNRSNELCEKEVEELDKTTIFGFRGPKLAPQGRCIHVYVQTFDTNKKTRAELVKEQKLALNENNCKKLGVPVGTQKFKNCLNSFNEANTKFNKSNYTLTDIVIGLLLLDSAFNSTQVTSSRNSNCFLSSVGMTGSGGLNGIICD